MSRTLTVAEVAERLRVKPITVREYLRKGKIPGSRIGKSWLILDVDLERFLGSRPEEPKPSPHEEWLALSPEEKARRVNAVMGKYKGCLHSVDDFMREKHEEVEEEERRWEERHKAELARNQENDAA